MIIDLQKFIASERPYWTELERVLTKLETDASFKLNLEDAKRFHYLYERTSADLGKIETFASEPELRRYLESIIARASGEIHETREKAHRVRPLQWLLQTFPQTFRRNIRAFSLSVAITIVGCIFGGGIVAFDRESKSIIMPFEHLLGDPSERVAKEERATRDRLEGSKSTFSAYLMTHNTQVSISTMALGLTWGIGTIVMLFYNGIIMGAVAVDYVLAGQSKFLVGWLLPHGSFEIPAILIAGQAGLMLGGAIIGWGKRVSLRTRLREVSRDLTTLIFGVGLMLIWAGFIESFLSQYHEPVVPYSAKIAFGVIELTLLAFYLGRSGVKQGEEKNSLIQ